MIVTLRGGEMSGTVKVPASKSSAHRALIVAALSEKPTVIFCDGISKDIAATIDCLNALGAEIGVDGEKITVSPIKAVPEGVCRLECGESGSTLRFLLPVVGALGANAEFYPKGRLISRPLAPLDSRLIEHGMTIEKTENTIKCFGKLSGGDFSIAGNISSQYISGLLMALPRLSEDSRLEITGEIQSQGYIKMTEEAIALSGVVLKKENGSYIIKGGQSIRMPDEVTVEGDYSGASFFLCLGALSKEGIKVLGLDPDSCQGDKAMLDILRRFGAIVTPCVDGIAVKKGTLKGITIDASQIPDIIPPLCVVAAAAEGETKIINAERLRIKESDRIETTVSLINSLGGEAYDLGNEMLIKGSKRLKGGRVDPFNDHRIAMSAAVAAAICDGDVSVDGAECVAKSYPRFWDEIIIKGSLVGASD